MSLTLLAAYAAWIFVLCLLTWREVFQNKTGAKSQGNFIGNNNKLKLVRGRSIEYDTLKPGLPKTESRLLKIVRW